MEPPSPHSPFLHNKRKSSPSAELFHTPLKKSFLQNFPFKTFEKDFPRTEMLPNLYTNSPYSKELYSDRFIPLRTDISSKNLFTIFGEDPPFQSQSSQKEEYNKLLEKELLDIPDFSSKMKETIKRKETFLTKKKKRNLIEMKPTPYKSKFTQVLKFRSPLQLKNKTPPIKVSPFGLQESDINITRPEKRTIMNKPYKTLDAPNLEDDFYLSLLDWSSQNILSVILSSNIFLYNFDNGHVSILSPIDSLNTVTSSSFDPFGTKMALGNSEGNIFIRDLIKNKVSADFKSHSQRVSILNWNSLNPNIFASGSKDKNIQIYDLRQEFSIRRLVGHKQEVCGLKWSPDCNWLASGGNDNKVFIWNEGKDQAEFRIDDHNAAVKALDWSISQRGLLVTGGGTNDTSIKFWNVLGKNLIKEVVTESQVCNVLFSKTVNEIVSTHGFERNEIVIWNYANLEKIKILNGHSSRVLFLAMSPNGRYICTGAGDETLKIWDIFPEIKLKQESVLNNLNCDLR